MISNLRTQPNTAFKQLIIKEESFKKNNREQEFEELNKLANTTYKTALDGLDHFQLDQEIVAYGDKLTDIVITDKLNDVSHHQLITERKPDPEKVFGMLLQLAQDEIKKRTKDLENMLDMFKPFMSNTDS